ncbi:MAG: putative rane protein ykoY [Chlamydiota bacterium]|jgi:YkoY family integral membrane protein
MLHQTFALTDIAPLFLLLFLEVILSADNAVVLGVFVGRLPQHKRPLALAIGFSSALIYRALALVFIDRLLHYKWIQIIAAAYLIYLSIKNLWFPKKTSMSDDSLSFWKIVLLIEISDFVLAIDSIFAGLAMIGATPYDVGIHPKLWIVYVGGMMGLLVIRYAAELFAKMVFYFPRLEKASHYMIGWIGLQMAYSTIPQAPHIELFFWSGLTLLMVFGLTGRKTA